MIRPIKPYLLLIILFLSTQFPGVPSARAQVSYLGQPELMERAERCLDHIYAWEFELARPILSELKELTPEHQAPLFLESLLVYWENFPLVPGQEEAIQFIHLLKEVQKRSEPLADSGLLYVEDVFFGLYGRALRSMFWADNGRSGKVIGLAGDMYRLTLRGMDLHDEQEAFYFSTGLYNYYIEAYPIAHPIYKPALGLMQAGDMQKGIRQLQYCMEHSSFMGAEANLFLSIIYLNFESNLDQAAYYGKLIHERYPRNLYYLGQLLIIQLYRSRYEAADSLIASLKQIDDPYARLLLELGRAYMLEGSGEDFGTGERSGEATGEGNGESRGLEGISASEKAYLRTLELADAFDEYSNIQRAVAYEGLSRIYLKKGLKQAGRKYHRKASRAAPYDFLLNERSFGAR